MSGEYQGYTNYETWCVCLWLNNEEGVYRDCLILAREAVKDRAPRSCLADSLKELLDEGNPLADQASVYSDLLTHAIESADWFEVADTFLELVGEH